MNLWSDVVDDVVADVDFLAQAESDAVVASSTNEVVADHAHPRRVGLNALGSDFRPNMVLRNNEVISAGEFNTVAGVVNGTRGIMKPAAPQGAVAHLIVPTPLDTSGPGIAVPGGPGCARSKIPDFKSIH